MRFNSFTHSAATRCATECGIRNEETSQIDKLVIWCNSFQYSLNELEFVLHEAVIDVCSFCLNWNNQQCVPHPTYTGSLINNNNRRMIVCAFCIRCSSKIHLRRESHAIKRTHTHTQHYLSVCLLILYGRRRLCWPAWPYTTYYLFTRRLRMPV